MAASFHHAIDIPIWVLLSLVAGDRVEVRSTEHPERRSEIRYTESVILPAALGPYEVVNLGRGAVVIVELDPTVGHEQRPAVFDDEGVAVGEDRSPVLDLGPRFAAAEHQGEALAGYACQGLPCGFCRIGGPVEQGAIKVGEEDEHMAHFKRVRNGVDPIEPVYQERKDTIG